jgi:hypothetical protein
VFRIRCLVDFDKRLGVALVLTNDADVGFSHRDTTTSAADACKNVSSIEIIMLAVFMGLTLGFDTKQRNSLVFDQIWWFFYNKNKILTILFIVINKKIARN